MKKSIAVLSLILAVNLAAKAHASELPDGELWLAMNADQKIIYLGGWNMATMVLKEYIMLKQAKAKAEREILSEEISRVPEKELLQHPKLKQLFNVLRDEWSLIELQAFADGWLWFEKPKTVSDGLDSFYKDYRNRRILLPWAMFYVLESIRGRPEQELQRYREFLRKKANEKIVFPIFLAPAMPSGSD